MMRLRRAGRDILERVVLSRVRRADHIMGMPAAQANWTVDMLDALPDDGQRYEVIDGVLHVTPAPSDVHQIVAGAFYVRIREYLRGSRLAYAMHSPSDVRKPDPSRNRVQPDVYAVRRRAAAVSVPIDRHPPRDRGRVAQQPVVRLSHKARAVPGERRARVLD